MITQTKLYGTEGDVAYHSRALYKLGVAQQEAEHVASLIAEYPFRVDAPVAIFASTSGVHVSFTLPESFTEEDQHFLVADIVRAFSVKLERKFSEYTGKFSFQGTVKKLADEMDIRVTVDDAKPGNCKIITITEMKPVTRYVSDCSGGGEATQPEPVGEQVNE